VIGFRPLEESDLPQVEAWLRAEHVAEWWRDPLEIAVEKRREALEGRREVEHGEDLSAQLRDSDDRWRSGGHRGHVGRLADLAHVLFNAKGFIFVE
jgi:hypothetical protein